MNVFWHLPQQADVSRTMQTSRSFYAAGIKPLLHAGVSIKDMRALVSFCRLILSDIPARAPHVRRLELCIEAEPEDYDESSDCAVDTDEDKGDSPCTGSRLLVQVLRGATRLHSLRIDHCEAFLELDSALAKAIQALPKLRCLHIHSIGDMTLSMLCELDSSLTEIDIHCYNEEDGTEEMDDPLPLVRRHQATLEKLSAWYVEILDNTLQFSNVRALALRQARGLDISILQHAFPNVTYLELSAVDDEESMDELREDNMARQRPESWRDLNCLCGSLDSLRILFRYVINAFEVPVASVGLTLCKGNLVPQQSLIYPCEYVRVFDYDYMLVYLLRQMFEGALAHGSGNNYVTLSNLCTIVSMRWIPIGDEGTCFQHS